MPKLQDVRGYHDKTEDKPIWIEYVRVEDQKATVEFNFSGMDRPGSISQLIPLDVVSYSIDGAVRMSLGLLKTRLQEMIDELAELERSHKLPLPSVKGGE